MSIYTCNICKEEYSHDKAYRHFLDCSWKQVKEQREAIYKPIDALNYLAGHGVRLYSEQSRQPEVQ
jgi:hypothetical protein